MKNIFFALVTLSLAVPAYSTSWNVAKITGVDILESSPVQYKIKYQRTCDDIAAKGIQVPNKTSVILGVLVQRVPNAHQCGDLSIPGDVKVGGAQGDNGGHALEVIKPDSVTP